MTIHRNTVSSGRTALAAIVLGAAGAVGQVVAQDSADANETAAHAVGMSASGNTMLITGGGSGIGRELAQRFHALGNTVIIAGRRIEPLRETIGERDNMYAVQLDVADPADVARVARELIASHPSLNVLVNNAGIMRYEDITSSRDLANADETITTNLLGPIRLTDALIDHLLTRPGATVINVSSGLAFVPRADAATYSASKAAIHSYTVSLRHALHGRAAVIELVPPGVQTDLTPGQATREGFMPLDEFIDEVMTLFAQSPVPDEIVVQRAGFQRLAEREGRFDQALQRINPR